VSYLGGDRAGCVSSTKFAVEFHDLSHQLLDQILAKNAESADMRILQMTFRCAKSLKYLVGAPLGPAD
jgi:hypothetical protein